MPPRRRDTCAVDSNHVTFWINPASLLHHDFGIHLDATLADQRFASATRRDAGLGEDLLQAHALSSLAH
jgi:hypothetical protein